MQISKAFRRPTHIQSAANVSQSPQTSALGRNRHHSHVPLKQRLITTALGIYRSLKPLERVFYLVAVFVITRE